MKAIRVLRSKQAIVIGPTPPGTGVIDDAFNCPSEKFTSPTSFVFFSSLISILLIPTSITIAPLFIQSPLINSGRPTAATKISAFLQSSARFFVF